MKLGGKSGVQQKRTPAVPLADRFRDIMTVPGTDELYDQNSTHFVWGPSMHKVGSTYYLLYSRWTNASFNNWYVNGEICLATSTSPTGTFTFDSVILDGTGSAWDEAIFNARLVEDGSNWRLYYAGCESGLQNTQQIGVATSTTIDGTYTKSGSNPILSPTALAWDSLQVNNPEVLLIDGTYYMWYKGKESGGYNQIGLASASSYDGTFTKSGSNPLISFADGSVEDPTVWQEGGKYRMLLNNQLVPHYQANSHLWLWSDDGVDWDFAPKDWQAFTVDTFDGTQSVVDKTSIYFDGGTSKAYLYAVQSDNSTTSEIVYATFATS